MACMEEKGNGMSICDPQEIEEVTQTMTGFVDNMSNFCNDFRKFLDEEDSLLDLITNTQQMSQWWEELLFATGGKLKLPKCFVYLIVWQFNEEGKAQDS